MLICDTHADTLYALADESRPAGRPLDVTARRLTEGGHARVQCLALFVSTGGMDLRPTIVERELAAFERLKAEGFCQITDLSQARAGLPNAMLTIEGGEAFGGDPGQVDRFADMGVRMAALVWNNENGLAHPAVGGEAGGLTPLGREVVRRMRARHMAVDVSHLNERGFYDLLDGQDIDRVIDHIAHMCDLGGENQVGLGSDFDGIDAWPEGLRHAGDIPALLEGMRRRGFAEPLVEAVAGLNFKRYMERL